MTQADTEQTKPGSTLAAKSGMMNRVLREPDGSLPGSLDGTGAGDPSARRGMRLDVADLLVPAIRWQLALVAMLFAGLWFAAGLSPYAAVVGFLVTALVIGRGRPQAVDDDASAAAEADPVAGDPVPGYAAVAEGLPDPCFLIDGSGNVQFENSAAQTLFGGLPAGQPISFALRAPEVGEAIADVLSNGNSVNVTFLERGPADRWFEARVSPLGSVGQAVRPPAIEQSATFLVLLRDLTEAQRVERMRVDFVANASHELRTPLASVTGFIETLQGPARNDPDARERFLEIMAEQARRMSRLIDDLMSLSRIELKAHVRPETVVDVGPILEHVADSMHPLSLESGVELKVEIRDRPLSVVGDRDELAQVFQNLVHNAIKYGQSGGRVDVMASLDRSEAGDPAAVSADAMSSVPPVISIAVRDYGPGIEAEHLPRLTERFYRVDTASSREKGGTGLGLAIVKHILNRHRGHLAIDSTPGKGAEFRVLLDVADPAP